MLRFSFQVADVGYYPNISQKKADLQLFLSSDSLFVHGIILFQTFLDQQILCDSRFLKPTHIPKNVSLWVPRFLQSHWRLRRQGRQRPMARSATGQILRWRRGGVLWTVGWHASLGERERLKRGGGWRKCLFGTMDAK